MANTYKPIGLEDTSGGGGSGDVSAYSQTFTTGSWVLSGSFYSLTIPAVTHGLGAKLVIATYELNGTSYEEVEVYVIINNTNDVTLRVGDDNRFIGKVIIQGE